MKAIFLSICTASALFASIGQITAIRGDAWVLRDSRSEKAHMASTLEVNDTIKTASNALVQVRFIDDTRLTLGKNSVLNINKYLIKGSESRVNLSADAGSYRVISGQIGKLARQNFKFNAQTLSIGIRGTEFVGKMSEQGGKIACAKGAIELALKDRKELLSAGEQAEYELDEIMHIGKFSARDFDILQDLGVDYHEPSSKEDVISNKGKAFKNHPKRFEARKIKEILDTPERNGDDELDKIMGL